MLKMLRPHFFVKISFLCGSLFLCSCDSSSSSGEFSLIEENDKYGNFSGLEVDPDFQTTLDRFVIEAEKRNISVDLRNLVILYGETNGALGVCSMQWGMSSITINPSLQNATDDLLSEIILHELGHCVLGREHSEDPTSIMHASIIIGEPWRAEVLDELFFGR